MANDQLTEGRETRKCELCQRERRTVAKVGPIEIKEPCENQCTKGYVRP